MMYRATHIYICFNIRELAPGDLGGPLGIDDGKIATWDAPGARCTSPVARRSSLLGRGGRPRPSGSDFWPIFVDFGSIFGGPGPTFGDFFRDSCEK